MFGLYSTLLMMLFLCVYVCVDVMDFLCLNSNDQLYSVEEQIFLLGDAVLTCIRFFPQTGPPPTPDPRAKAE